MAWLWLAYPITVHAAVITQSLFLQGLAVGLLPALVLLPAILKGRLMAWIGLLSSAVIATLLTLAGLAKYFMYLPPILINLFLAQVFLQSLATRRRPIISLVAEKIRGDSLSPALSAYTRRLTVLWGALFILMAGLSGALAVWASAELWSAFTNLYSYLILGAVFTLEFLLRRFLLPNETHVSLANYMREMTRINFRQP